MCSKISDINFYKWVKLVRRKWVKYIFEISEIVKKHLYEIEKQSYAMFGKAFLSAA